jgi:hypothetical protein
MNFNSYGFIITRHVNSETTNKYWNHSIRCIRYFYPNRKIVIIDDNSNQEFVKAEYDYKNVEYQQSEYPGRGELLPYIYFIRNHYFDNAVIIHDSVFFHKRVNFEKLLGVNVAPFWHFDADKENFLNSLKISRRLQNSYEIERKITLNDTFILGLNNKYKWHGCFGVQSYINRNFLINMNKKYNINNLINVVHNRSDRCCLERIFGVLFNEEDKSNKKVISIFGIIHNYQKFGYSFESYMNDLKNKKLPKYVVKVWTGR